MGKLLYDKDRSVTHLTDLADRLAKLVQEYPDSIPTEHVEVEVRRVKELAHMVAEGLVE